MDFILNQQAQFAANIQLLRETQAQLTISQATSEVRLDKIEEAILKLVDVVERLASGLDRTESLLAGLSDAQAQTEASLQKLSKAQSRTERELSDSQDRTEVSLQKLSDAQDRTEASLQRLSDAQDRTDRELAASHARLARSQEHTDHRLNNLVSVVERYISSRTNGDPD